MGRRTGILSNSQDHARLEHLHLGHRSPSGWGARWTARSARCASAACPGTLAAGCTQQGRLARTADGGTHGGPDHGHHQVYGHQACPFLGFRPFGLRLGMTDAGPRRGPSGPPMDSVAERRGWCRVTAALTKRDDDQHFRRSARRTASWCLNYGVQLVYRGQNNEVFKLSTSLSQDQTLNESLSRTDLEHTPPTPTPSLTPAHRRLAALSPAWWFQAGLERPSPWSSKARPRQDA